MITPFTLPSNPQTQIQLREATVADAIDFADVDQSHEEELTTMFLARMQDGKNVRDSRKWTAEDRRFALYWYWLHTSGDHDVALSYDCQYCGERHTYLQNFRELAENYTPINGQAERRTDWRGEKIMIRPLSGADMETLERMKIGLDVAKEGSKEYNKKQIMMMFERLILCVTLADQKADKRKKIMAMPLKEFSEFTAFVTGLLLEMKHGLESEYENGRLFLIMPGHKCPEKGEETRTRFPFRNIDYIPGL